MTEYWAIMKKRFTSVKENTWRSYIVGRTILKIVFKSWTLNAELELCKRLHWKERLKLTKVLACSAYSWKRAHLYPKKESVDEEKLACHWYPSGPTGNSYSSVQRVQAANLSGRLNNVWTPRIHESNSKELNGKREEEPDNPWHTSHRRKGKIENERTETERKPKKKIHFISFTLQPSSCVLCCAFFGWRLLALLVRLDRMFE